LRGGGKSTFAVKKKSREKGGEVPPVNPKKGTSEPYSRTGVRGNNLTLCWVPAKKRPTTEGRGQSKKKKGRKTKCNKENFGDNWGQVGKEKVRGRDGVFGKGRGSIGKKSTKPK